jgi:apolipoprotein N-acyltransferase
MKGLLAIACALPLALSHDIGGPLALVALAPLMAFSLRFDRPFAFGFVCGFAEVFMTLWGTADYSLLIPLTLALQGGLGRGALAWAVGRRSGPLLPLTVLILAQGLRASSELSLPLSCGHDLASVWFLAWPAAFGGGALLTALCGLSAYALSHAAESRKQAASAFSVLLLFAAGHELLRPAQQPSIPLKASIIQGGLPNWVYRQASIDQAADALISRRYLLPAAKEPPGRLLVLPESALRESWGQGPMSSAYRQLHASGASLIAGLNRHVDGALRNSVMFWGNTDKTPSFQSKRMLVPLVERDFQLLDEPELKLPHDGRVMLCIESVYPRFARRADARWLLVLSNDAGVGRSSARRAFEREARLRAVEMGRSLIRAGQDGFSYAISPRAQLLWHLPRYKAGLMRIETLPGALPSLRGFAGDWLFWLCWPLLLLGLRARSEPRELGV